MRLETVKFMSTAFVYEIFTKTFTSEASKLGHFFSRIYDDAGDVGLTIISGRTQKECTFFLQSTHTNLNGDIESFEFLPLDPVGGDTKVVVFNI
jgi:hypothetical protein